jgi:multiple sugar transport system ATP-binding protein
MIKVEVEKLCKHYAPHIVALDDVTLSVAAGECLALLGPSGGGKTTLLRLLAGLEEASEGEIRFDGEVVNDVPAHRRGVAMMFQRPALLPARTVWQNLRWNWELAEPWLPMRRVLGGDRGREEELGRVARLLGLEQELDRPVGQLSGGQQQRVALGQCLLRKTKVCLLDEPLGQLDAPLRTGLRRAIRQFAREEGVTLVYVTHDPEEALAVGDRVAVFRHGRLIQIATPRQMRQGPRDQFVAELIYQNIGGLNLLAGNIRQDGLDTFFENAFGRWPMLATTVSGLHQALQDSAILHASDDANPGSDKNFRTDMRKSPIIIGVPAIDVHCTTAVTASEEDVRLRISYRDQECGWKYNWILGASEQGQWVGRADDNERFEQGQTVTMIFSMTQAFWFDGATGRTLLTPTG